jgi:hypothetical protein
VHGCPDSFFPACAGRGATAGSRAAVAGGRGGGNGRGSGRWRTGRRIRAAASYGRPCRRAARARPAARGPGTAPGRTAAGAPFVRGAVVRGRVARAASGRPGPGRCPLPAPVGPRTARPGRGRVRGAGLRKRTYPCLRPRHGGAGAAATHSAAGTPCRPASGILRAQLPPATRRTGANAADGGRSAGMLPEAHTGIGHGPHGGLWPEHPFGGGPGGSAKGTEPAFRSARPARRARSSDGPPLSGGAFRLRSGDPSPTSGAPCATAAGTAPELGRKQSLGRTGPTAPAVSPISTAHIPPNH